MANKSDKIANHPVLNPNFIIGKKENNQHSNFNKNPDFKINFMGKKDIRKSQENNKNLKEKIKEKAKNTELILLNNNKISYENEKIMKKIDEFDSRLFKNVYQKNIDSRQHNKDIKISYIEKIEQENNIYPLNEINSAFNLMKAKDKSKDKNSKQNLVDKKRDNIKITPDLKVIKNDKAQSNKNITNNKIDPSMIQNLFPYSKDILSNKNSSCEANIYFKNNYLLSNILSNREEESSENLNLINEVNHKYKIANFQNENKLIKVEKKASLELTPSKLEELSEKVIINFNC